MKHHRTLQGQIEMVRRASSPRGRRRTGLFVIEGTRLVERAMRAGAGLESVLVAESLAADSTQRNRQLMEALQQTGCPLYVAQDAVLLDITEGRDLGLILALVHLPESITLEGLMSQIATEAPLLLPAAVDIVDPGNVGALMRTAHAAGARALLVSGVSDPYHPRATQTSRGSVFKLPILHFDSPTQLLAELQQHAICTIAATADGGIRLPDMLWPSGPTAILLGNEARGLPPSLANKVDYQLSIPMATGVDSYSVNAAAAIILYAAGTARGRR